MNARFHRTAGATVDTIDADQQCSRLALLLSLLLLFVLIGCDRFAGRAPRSAATPTPANPMLVAVIELEMPPRLHEDLIVFGQLTPARVQRLNFDDPGRIGALSVESGQQVAVDTPLAQLDVTQLRSQRARQEEAVNKYRNELASSARTPTESSLNQLRLLEGQLQQTDQQLQRSVMRAPFAGRVGAIYVRAGQPISAGMPILELEDLSRPAVLAKLTGDLSGQLATAIVTAKVGDQSFPVEYSAASSPAPLDSPLTQFQFSGDQYPADWRVGQVTKLTFQVTNDSPGFPLPTSSLIQGKDEQWAVFLAVFNQESDQYVIEQRDLNRVQYRGAEVVVEGNLMRGDQVVADGTQRIVPGQTVIPVPSERRIDQLDSPGATGSTRNGSAP